MYVASYVLVVFDSDMDDQYVGQLEMLKIWLEILYELNTIVIHSYEF